MDETYAYRFGGIERLYSAEDLAWLGQAHIAVVGVGGVGAWTVEALARSGVGTLTLIDWDDICITNVNRQLHALDGTLGKAKVDVLAERVRAINPSCTCHAVRAFYTKENAEELLGQGFDCVVDAIDGVSAKCHLIASCRQRRIRIVTVGGAGGRIDPTRIETADLRRAYKDPLLAYVRKKLRQKYEFPRDTRKRFRVDCVFSPEEIRLPPACEPSENMRLDCASGYGAATFVTGTFGFVAAARALERVLTRKRATSERQLAAEENLS